MILSPGHNVRRREFISLLGSATTAWALPTNAQQTGKVYRVAGIAIISPVSELTGPNPINPLARAALQGLRDLGYEEGRNLVMEWRSIEGKYDRTEDIVRELVRLKVDVIVTAGNGLALRARKVTTTVPIVMLSSTDPVGVGLVQSLARPGGNVTGMTTDTGPEMTAKRMELLKEAVPDMRSVAILVERGWFEGPWGQATETAARAVGVAVIRAETKGASYHDAFAVISREKPDALFAVDSPHNYGNRQLIVDFATKHRLPVSFSFREAIEGGALMSYGVDLRHLVLRAVVYVDRILKGANPADLPIEQPTKFELVLNLRTAKALGRAIPESILLRATEVIE